MMHYVRGGRWTVLSCLVVLQLYQEAGVVAEGFTGVPVFQVRLRLQQCSMAARQWHRSLASVLVLCT